MQQSLQEGERSSEEKEATGEKAMLPDASKGTRTGLVAVVGRLEVSPIAPPPGVE